MAVINIIREKRALSCLVPWNVAISGAGYNPIANGETRQFLVPPGYHTVSVYKGGASATMMVEVSEAAPATLVVRPRPFRLMDLISTEAGSDADLIRMRVVGRPTYQPGSPPPPQMHRH